MMSSNPTPLTQRPTWKALEAHYQKIRVCCILWRKSVFEVSNMVLIWTLNQD